MTVKLRLGIFMAIAGAVILSGLPSIATATTITYETQQGYTLVVPDSLTVRNVRIGSQVLRSVDEAEVVIMAPAGSTFPLRFSASGVVVDSANGTLALASVQANFSGMAKLSLVLKGPVPAGEFVGPFKLMLPGLPLKGQNPQLVPEVPISVNWTGGATADGRSTGVATPSPATDSLATAISERDKLRVELRQARAEIRALETRLKRICSSRPRPRFC